MLSSYIAGDVLQNVITSNITAQHPLTYTKNLIKIMPFGGVTMKIKSVLNIFISLKQSLLILVGGRSGLGCNGCGGLEWYWGHRGFGV